MIRSNFRISVTAAILALCGALALYAVAHLQTDPSVSTDEPQYGAFDLVTITGANFEPNQQLDIVVVHPDNQVMTGDGSWTPGFDSLTAQLDGSFIYYYQLFGYAPGVYTVNVYDSADTAHATVLASTTFIDGKISSLTLKYKNFGFGTPVSFTIDNSLAHDFAHFAPGPDSNHGPITIAADGTFTINHDLSGLGGTTQSIGPTIELKLQIGANSLLIKIHTSCSFPIAPGHIFGPDDDGTSEEWSEFAPSGPYTAGVEVVSLIQHECDFPSTPTPTPTVTATHTATPVPPTATPVTPTATPVTPTATPVTPTATPVTPTATPVTPTATPVTPTATPVTPTATPETPTATPVTPTATPVTPTATPVTPTATATPGDPTSDPLGFHKDTDLSADGVQAEGNLWICKGSGFPDPFAGPSDNLPAGQLNCNQLTIGELLSAVPDIDTCNDDDDGDGKPCAGNPNNPIPEPFQDQNDGCSILDDDGNLLAENYIPGQTAVDCDGGEVGEGIGAWELQIKYDHKLFQQPIATCEQGPFGDRVVQAQVQVITENWILFGCVSKSHADPTQGLPFVPGALGFQGYASLVTLTIQPDLFQRIRPTKDNGVVTDLLDENCEVADAFGMPHQDSIQGGLTPVCADATITIRMLEGDINLDCIVDVVDDQQMAYRYGSFFGNLLYHRFFDLEPNIAPDFDIDVKDLQTVFGRNGSTCANPVPDQHPHTTTPDP